MYFHCALLFFPDDANKENKQGKRSQKKQTKRTRQDMEGDEVQGLPLLRDKTERENILASAQKRQKVIDVPSSQPVKATSDQPDENDKVVSPLVF